MLKYEDIEIGDVVCVRTESGDMDVKTLGIVTHKLEKSSYEPMRVIEVRHHYYELHGKKVFAPKELIKLTSRQVYHVMNLMGSWKHFENIQIKR